MNNGRTEWTVADAAVLFKEPVEDLVSDFAIEAISGGSEYQLNQNGSVDISRRELSAPAGSRVSARQARLILPVDDSEKLFIRRQWFGISGARKPRT